MTHRCGLVEHSETFFPINACTDAAILLQSRIIISVEISESYCMDVNESIIINTKSVFHENDSCFIFIQIVYVPIRSQIDAITPVRE